MLQIKSLREFSDSKFLANAYSDYLQEVNSKYSQLVNLINEMTMYDGDPNDQDYETFITDKISEYQFHPLAKVTFAEGYITLHDLCYAILNNVDQYSDAEEDDPIEALLDENIVLTDNIGNIVSEKLSVNSALEELKTTLHSSVCTQAAIAASVIDDMSARITCFKDKVSAAFTNIFDDVSGTFAAYMNMLGSEFSGVQPFVDNLQSMLGVDAQASIDGFVLNDADFTQITGANPVAAFNWNTPVDVLISIGKTIGSAVRNGFAKIGDWFTQKTNQSVNWLLKTGMIPQSLSVVDDKQSSNTIDMWGVQKQHAQISSSNLRYSGYDSQDILDAVVQYQSKVGHWIKFNTMGAEILYRINSLSSSITEYFWYIQGDVDYAIKFKPIKKETLCACLNAAGWSASLTYESDDVRHFWPKLNFNNTRTFQNAESADQALGELVSLLKISNASDLNVSKSNDIVEGYYMDAFATGAQFALWLFHSLAEVNANHPESQVTIYGDIFDYGQPSGSGSNVKWVKLLSGWNGDAVNPVFGNPQTRNGSFSCDSGMSGLFTLLILQQYERTFYPLEYTFIPYRNNVAKFDVSKFAILTDDDIQRVWTNFLTAAVTIYVVTAVVVTATVLISYAASALFFKKLAYVGRMDNKMWNGGTLDPSERWKYTRYSRKINASKILTGGIQESVTKSLTSLTSNSDGDVLSYLQNLYQLIRG